jgi:hypothetical protein
VNTSRGFGGALSATRTGTPGWRDPRLWIGVAIVAVSVVAGVRIVGGADDSISVWAVTEDLETGAALDPDQLEARAVRFADVADADRYLLTDEPLPTGDYLLRGIGAGELVPAAALGAADQTGVVQVPIKVPSDGLPPSVGVGSRVDVYVSDESEARRPAVLLLGDVPVTAVPGSSDELGPTGDRQLVLGVPEGDDDLGLLIAASTAGTLTVVGRS